MGSREPSDVEASRLARRARKDAVAQVGARQSGLLARRQLRALGVGDDVVRRRVAAGRWALRSATVISTTTGPLSDEQRRWLALLHTPHTAALAGRTALELHGLRGWESTTVTVVVGTNIQGRHLDGVEFWRTRRPFDQWICHRSRLPVLAVEPAALLLASRVPSPRSAGGLLAACVQQRLVPAERLQSWLPRLPELRRSTLIAALLEDIAGGAHSMGEIDVGEMCREHGLEPPRRQVRRTDSSGTRRWTDAEWDLPDGRVVALEVDGSFHRDVEQWIDDMARQRRLVDPMRLLVRCSTIELRTDSAQVAADLAALGVPQTRSAAA